MSYSMTYKQNFDTDYEREEQINLEMSIQEARINELLQKYTFTKREELFETEIFEPKDGSNSGRIINMFASRLVDWLNDSNELMYYDKFVIDSMPEQVNIITSKINGCDVYHIKDIYVQLFECYSSISERKGQLTIKNIKSNQNSYSILQKCLTKLSLQGLTGVYLDNFYKRNKEFNYNSINYFLDLIKIHIDLIYVIKPEFNEMTNRVEMIPKVYLKYTPELIKHNRICHEEEKPKKLNLFYSILN